MTQTENLEKIIALQREIISEQDEIIQGLEKQLELKDKAASIKKELDDFCNNN